MKILNFGVLYFKLPDDFSGGLADALRIMADYHESRAGTPEQKIEPPRSPPTDISADEHEEAVWDVFWKHIHEGPFRIYGSVGLSEYPVDGKSVGFDLNTGEIER